MGVFNWINLATAPFALGDVGKARDFAAFFRGACQINMGTSLYGFYGERQTHVFGNDIKLVSCGAYGGIGGFLGKFMNESGPLLGLLGMNGDASVVMGPRIAITYGGPKVEIQRGPVLRKIGYKSVYASHVNWDVASVRLAGNQPQQPVGNEAAAMDEKTERAILALSVLLNLVTASFELAIRFKYPDYDPKAQSAFDTPKILNIVVTTISDVIMGLIYCIETAGSWTQWADEFKDNAAESAEKVGFYLGCLTLILPAKWFAEWLGRTYEEGSDTLKAVMIGIGFLVFAALVLGLTLGLTIGRK